MEDVDLREKDRSVAEDRSFEAERKAERSRECCRRGAVDALVSWARVDGSDLARAIRAALPPVAVVLGLLLAGCAGPRASEVRTFAGDVRLLLGVVAPCSTLTQGEASAARALAVELDATAKVIGGGP